MNTTFRWTRIAAAFVLGGAPGIGVRAAGAQGDGSQWDGPGGGRGDERGPPPGLLAGRLRGGERVAASAPSRYAGAPGVPGAAGAAACRVGRVRADAGARVLRVRAVGILAAPDGHGVVALVVVASAGPEDFAVVDDRADVDDRGAEGIGARGRPGWPGRRALPNGLTAGWGEPRRRVVSY